jgi:glycosyltransferase involved in cell wall biosynthesis
VTGKEAAPIVSFVVPALNAERTVASCLEAIRGTEAAGWGREVLVIDNGSSDDTRRISHAEGARVLDAPGLTVGGLRNLGARVASGRILACVDADCVVASDWLIRGLRHFVDPQVGAVGSPTGLPPQTTWVQRSWALQRHRKRPGPVQWLPTENLLIRREAFWAVGGFNEALVTCEDVDFCYRLAARYLIVNDPAVRSIHLGEAPTLRAVFRKEVWRGRGNLPGVLAHRLRLSELPSVLLPLYHLALLTTLMCASAAADGKNVWRAGVLLIAPSALAALRTAIQARRLHDWPALAAVYATYFAARSTAIVKESLVRPRRSSPPRPGSVGAR